MRNSARRVRPVLVGSSAGIAAFNARHVDFGTSEVPMTASEQAAAKRGPITQLPVALGGEGAATTCPSRRVPSCT
jgi:ABC-type phosphate transport system substrate-binding protein